MILSLFTFLLSQGADLRVPMSMSEPLALRTVTVPETGRKFERFEIRVDLRATYSNPFHPAQIELTAKFAGPKNVNVVVPGFYYQEFKALPSGFLEKVGDPIWLIRFTPPFAGNWNVRIKARDREDQVETKKYDFKIEDTTSPGFIRVGPPERERIEYSDQEDLKEKLLRVKRDNHFRFDNQTSFFGIGLNMGWAESTADFTGWFEKLAANGGNLVRIWSFPAGLGLEWSDKQDDTWRKGTYYGLGKYSLDNAWLLDHVLEAAEKNGIKVILCLGTYGELKADKGMWNEDLWKVNPYSTANGGPVENPDDFFTNLKARAFYRQRLRYTVSRWSYSPSILAWELWNEVKAPDYWVHEMAGELKDLDPAQHLVTTSYGDTQVWKDEFIDFATAHIYGDGASSNLMERISKEAVLDISPGIMPVVISEWGIDFKKPDGEYDPDGAALNLKMGLWQAAASGCAAGAMNWWWDSYVAKQDLWKVYRPFADAVAKVPWTASPTRRAELKGMPGGLLGSGVLNKRGGFAWLRRSGYDWKNPVLDARVSVPFLLTMTAPTDLDNGKWTAIWWNTTTGKEIETQEITVSSNEVNVKAPSFGSDIALILVKP